MESTADVERLLAHDRELHLSASNQAPTTVLTELVLNLWNHTQQYRQAVTRLFLTQGDRSLHFDHHLIVGALQLADSDEAVQVLAQHSHRNHLGLARRGEVVD
ncbi:FCD domain-containing protein [Arthrobacter sp. B0490]|uniref:FCD domain-containing protein n=1 Tax=Arthrobacter sp. B0490 TaxID=2058891 RepID=UPI0034D45612